jgi:hypothetical protein
MAGINLTIDKKGSGFKINDACDGGDGSQCMGVWGTLMNHLAAGDGIHDGNVEMTERYHQHEELPELEEGVDV